MEAIGGRRIDVLINNAGLQYVATLEDFPPDQWDLLVRVMLNGACLMTRAVLPGMKRHGSRRHREHRIDSFAGGLPIQERLRVGQARTAGLLQGCGLGDGPDGHHD